MVFSSPRFWPKNDCKFLEKLLLDQAKTLVDYSFTEEDEKKLKSPKIRISGKKEVSVSIPDKEANTDVSDVGEERESIRVQAKLRSEENTSELQSLTHIVCRILLE